MRRATVYRRLPRALLAALITLVLVTGCSLPQTNFSQYPGFAQYFAAHPPRDALPDTAEQALLVRHRPRFFVPPDHAGLIDFYRDYIAQGQLSGGDGRLVSAQVTPELLNAHKDDARAVFTHIPKGRAASPPTVFARIDHDDIAHDGHAQRLTFLTYHTVFRHSGIAAGFSGWQAAMASLFVNLDDWHQLDHYTAATVVLDATARPVALVLQQHNYHHTYVLGPALPLPADARLAFDVAARSNELYPHSRDRVRHRAVRFNSAQEMRYLMGFGDKPTVAEEDITEGRDEVDYQLAFLPPSDAFYTFKGFLGERRRMPGRDGPPGADFNTLPEIKPPASQMLMGFWRAGNRDDLARLESTYARTGRQSDFVQAQKLPFLQAIGAAP